MQLGGAPLTSNASAGYSVSGMALISNQDWKSAQSGQVVVLTEEERRTLVAEGYPIPQRFPLSKAEERSLKKIRRKIKNKISAQESRRKKKEYMEELEKKVHSMERKIAELERENRLFKERLPSVGANTMGAPAAPVQVADSRQQPSDSATKRRHFGANNSNPELAKCEQPDSRDTNNERELGPDRAAAGVDCERRPELAGAQVQGRDASGQQNQHQQQQQQQPSTDDDYFIDDILMSQERQEQRDEVDLVANLVGVVCENDDLSIVRSICDQMSREEQASRLSDRCDLSLGIKVDELADSGKLVTSS